MTRTWRVTIAAATNGRDGQIVVEGPDGKKAVGGWRLTTRKPDPCEARP